MEWLDAHAGSVQATLALVLVVVTGYYAWQTHGQVSAANASIGEMKQARQAQLRAYVTLELWPWDRNMAVFDIAIRNHGAGAARDIHVVFEPDFLWPAGGIGGTGMVNEIQVFRDLPFLGPHDEFLVFAGRHDWLSNETAPQDWTGYVEFTDDTGPHRLPFRLNMRQLRQIQCMLPYGEPSWAPPIRRGWGRLQGPDKHPTVGDVKLS